MADGDVSPAPEQPLGCGRVGVAGIPPGSGSQVSPRGRGRRCPRRRYPKGAQHPVQPPRRLRGDGPSPPVGCSWLTGRSSAISSHAASPEPSALARLRGLGTAARRQGTGMGGEGWAPSPGSGRLRPKGRAGPEQGGRQGSAASDGGTAGRSFLSLHESSSYLSKAEPRCNQLRRSPSRRGGRAALPAPG